MEINCERYPPTAEERVGKLWNEDTVSIIFEFIDDNWRLHRTVVGFIESSVNPQLPEYLLWMS